MLNTRIAFANFLSIKDAHYHVESSLKSAPNALHTRSFNRSDWLTAGCNWDADVYDRYVVEEDGKAPSVVSCPTDGEGQILFVEVNTSDSNEIATANIIRCSNQCGLYSIDNEKISCVPLNDPRCDGARESINNGVCAKTKQCLKTSLYVSGTDTLVDQYYCGQPIRACSTDEECKTAGTGWEDGICTKDYKCSATECDTTKTYLVKDKATGLSTCEANDTENCGEINRDCNKQNLNDNAATRFCDAGQCVISTCDKGYHEVVDDTGKKTCEHDTETSCGGVNCRLLAGWGAGTCDTTTDKTPQCHATLCNNGFHISNTPGSDEETTPTIVPCATDTNEACGDIADQKHDSDIADQKHDNCITNEQYSKGNYRCVDSECQLSNCKEGYHAYNPTLDIGIEPTDCVKDHALSCKSKNCTLFAGWKEGTCNEDLECEATQCQVGYHRLNTSSNGIFIPCELDTLTNCGDDGEATDYTTDCTQQDGFDTSIIACVQGQCLLQGCRSDQKHHISNRNDDDPALPVADYCRKDDRYECGHKNINCTALQGVADNEHVECLDVAHCYVDDNYGCKESYHPTYIPGLAPCEADSPDNCGETGKKCPNDKKYCTYNPDKKTSECSMECNGMQNPWDEKCVNPYDIEYCGSTKEDRGINCREALKAIDPTTANPISVNCELEPTNKYACLVTTCPIGSHISQDKTKCEWDTVDACGSYDYNCNDNKAESVVNYSSCPYGSCIVSACETGYHAYPMVSATSCHQDSDTECGPMLMNCTNDDTNLNAKYECEYVETYTSSQCVFKGCKPGAHLVGNDQCELDTDDKCGETIENCTTKYAHGTSTCQNGQCSAPQCEPDYEFNTTQNQCIGNTLTNCGIDATDCTKNLPNNMEASACTNGVCVNQCITGFGDCNSTLTDGCETNLTTYGLETCTQCAAPYSNCGTSTENGILLPFCLQQGSHYRNYTWDSNDNNYSHNHHDPNNIYYDYKGSDKVHTRFGNKDRYYKLITENSWSSEKYYWSSDTCVQACRKTENFTAYGWISSWGHACKRLEKCDQYDSYNGSFYVDYGCGYQLNN